MARCEIMNNLKLYHLFTPQSIPDRPLTIPEECVFSTDSAHSFPDCIPTTVAQRKPFLSKVFNHQLKDKALKIFNTLDSLHYSNIKLLFLTQSAPSIPKKQYQLNTNANSQSVS